MTTRNPDPVRERHVVLQNPPSGTTVRMAVGRQLAVRFPPRVGPSRWRVADAPHHLVPLPADRHELCFLVFGGGPGRLRLERANPAGAVQEVRDVYVVTTGGAGRGPAPRSARPVAS